MTFLRVIGYAALYRFAQCPTQRNRGQKGVTIPVILCFSWKVSTEVTTSKLFVFISADHQCFLSFLRAAHLHKEASLWR